MDADASLVKDGCKIVGEFLEGRVRYADAYQYHSG